MGLLGDIFDQSLPGIFGTIFDAAGDRVLGPGDYGWNPGPTAIQNYGPVTTPGVPAVVVAPPVTRIPATVMTSQGKTMEGCASKVKTVVTYDCVTGQIIKVSPYKRRRRRRRLATASDIADLQALKSILGKGQALSSYLATEGRGR